MATTNYFYAKSNNGSTTLFTSSARFGSSATATVTKTGITFSNGEVYTYSGSKKFVGVARSANATVSDFSFGDTFSPYSYPTVYIVEEEISPEYILRIDGVEVTDYENVIINGVSYKCKKDEPNLISFTLDRWVSGDLQTGYRVTYQCEEGMTWEEFINSEYNTNFFIYNNKVYYKDLSYVNDTSGGDVVIIKYNTSSPSSNYSVTLINLSDKITSSVIYAVWLTEPGGAN